MKNILLIFITIIFLFSCNNPTEETVIEIESIPAETPNNTEKEIIDKEVIQEEGINPSTPNGQLLYSKDQLFIYKNKAILKGNILYDGVAKLAKLIKNEQSEDCPVNYAFNYNPLSLIGNYYSYELSEFGDYACGPPSSSRYIKNMDIYTEKPIKITDIFTEKSIIETLKKDGWIIKNAKKNAVDLNSIKTFDDFLEAFNNSDSSQFDASSFAILDYDKEKNLAAVRLIGSSYMGFNHSEYLQLGMWIKPSNEMEELLKEKSFFYLGKFDNGVKK